MNLFWSSLAVKEKNQLNAVRSQETHPKKCVHQSCRQTEGGINESGIF